MEVATSARLDAERRWLVKFLPWAFWALIVFAGFQLAGGAAFGDGALLLTAGLSFIYAGVLVLGRRLLVAGRLAMGLSVIVGGMALLQLAILTAIPRMYPVDALVPVLGLAIVMPFLTQRSVMPVAIGFVAWSAATGLIGELAPDTLDIPRSAVVVFRVAAIGTIVALLFAVLWRSRQRADRAFRESSETDRRMRDLVESALDAVIAIEGDGRVIGWNPQAEEIFGWTREEAEGRSLAELIVPPAFRAAHRAGLEHVARTGDGPILNKRIEVPALHRSGREFPIELTIVPVEIDGRQTFSAFARDISPRKEIEQERRSLLRRIVQAQEEERRRVAVGLHDDAVQQMTAVGLRIATLRTKEREHDERLAQIEAVADGAVEAMRRFLFELSPPAFERGGLVKATESFAAQLAKEFRFGVEVVDATDRTLDPETQIVAYRVVQEALTNVARHAGARSVKITVAIEQDELHLCVHDDGRGFDPEQGGAGIGSMRERAALVGGRVAVRSAHGHGTTLDLWLPAPPLDGGSEPPA
jgi:PAS domain S-box-containing protein